MAIIDTKLVIDEQVFDISVVEEVTEVSDAGEVTNIYVDEGVTMIVTEAEQGPPGAQGISEDEMTYSKRVDFITDNLIYKGEATVGSLTTDALWRVRKIEIGIDGDISETWANGNAGFLNVWDNRSLLTYS